MPDDFDLRYTPKFYESFGKVIQLDLGSTAQEVVTTRERVAELPEALGKLLKPTTDGIAKLGTDLSDHLASAVTELKDHHASDIGASQQALARALETGFKQVLDAVHANVPVTPAKGLSLTGRSAPVIRPLTQVLTLAVDANPGQPDKQVKTEWGENVTLKKLAESAEAEAAVLEPALRERYRKAFRTFETKSFEERHQRYAEVHALIAEIAAALLS